MFCFGLIQRGFIFFFFLFPLQKVKQISPSKMYKEADFGRIFKQVNVVIEGMSLEMILSYY